MAQGGSQWKGKLSPLWVITAFLTFTEVVITFAVTKAEGSVLIALTTFAISFPLLIAGAFFYILWHRPWVLYPPSDYADIDVTRFVDAMQRRQSDERKTLELVQETLRSTASTPETQRFADTTLRRVQEHVLDVDLSPITGDKKSRFIAIFQPDRLIHEFLDDMWLLLADYVPAYTFGSVWGLRDRESGRVFVDLGRRWAKKHRKKDDVRTLKEVGFVPSMKLEAIMLDGADAAALAA